MNFEGDEGDQWRTCMSKGQFGLQLILVKSNEDVYASETSDEADMSSRR
jgi:hypothetical protein